MDRFSVLVFLVITAFITIVVTCNADAFHSGHTGECDSCHGLNSAGNNFSSLLGIDPSSTCLRCHAASKPSEHQIATHPVPPNGVPPVALTPGGDFAYLRKNYTW